jgi:hypothetical protein
MSLYGHNATDVNENCVIRHLKVSYDMIFTDKINYRWAAKVPERLYLELTNFSDFSISNCRRPFFNFAPRGEFLSQGLALSPRDEV